MGKNILGLFSYCSCVFVPSMLMTKYHRGIRTGGNKGRRVQGERAQGQEDTRAGGHKGKRVQGWEGARQGAVQ